MKLFDFIQITDEIDYNREIYSYVAIPSPNEKYETTLKYYKFPNMKNVEIKINPLSKHICDKVYIYIRKIQHNQYAVFNYNDCIEIRTTEVDKYRYTDVLNIAQIITNVSIKWEEIESYIP